MTVTVSTVDIGPVSTTPYSFTASRNVASGPIGFAGVTLAGMMEIAKADQLDELVNNPFAHVTVKGVTGRLEFVSCGSAALPSYTGMYLLQTFDQSPDGIDADWPYVSFSLKGLLIPSITAPAGLSLIGGTP
jgi:hypothetical protein